MTNNETDLVEIATEFGYSAGDDLACWLRSKLEIAKGHDARVSELLASNNDQMEQTRAARKDAVGWRSEFDMFARAWHRSLGSRVIKKAHLIDALVLTTEQVVARAAHADRLDAIAAGDRHGIYVASKVGHAPMWKMLRSAGLPIISTWIDEAGQGESKSLADLWLRCIAESSSAEILIVYRIDDEILKGGWVELGSAIATGVQVYAVGIGSFTVANHPAITHFDTLEAAIAAPKKAVAKAV